MSPALIAQVAVSTGSLASVLLAGRRLANGKPRFPRAPWLLLIGSHGLFLAYALASGQPGFLLLNVGMVTAGVINLRAGREPRKAAGTAGPERVATPQGMASQASAGRD